MSFSFNTQKSYYLNGFLQSIPALTIFPQSNNLINNDKNLPLKNSSIIQKCGISLANIQNPFRPINCFHYFCRLCILKWYNCGNNTCPICRRNFSMLAPKNFDEMRKEIKNSFYYKSKQYQIMKRLKRKNGQKLMCDLCEEKDNEDNLLICICCNLFYCHFFCDFQLYFTDFGYICPNCRYIFNLEL